MLISDWVIALVLLVYNSLLVSHIESQSASFSGVNPFLDLGESSIVNPVQEIFEPKNSDFSEIFLIFQAKISHDLFWVLNSNNVKKSLYIRLSPEIFTFDTCILSFL